MSLHDKVQDIYAKSKNTSLPMKVIPGHFVTNHSHINYYIDLTSMKMIQKEAKQVAEVLSRKYMNYIPVETILCMDGTEVIGAMLAEILTKSNLGRGIDSKTEIAVITPEQNANTSQLILRDNIAPMVKDRDCIVLTASITTGYSIHKALETISFYGGVPRGVSSVFSNIAHMDGVDVDSIYTVETLPDYRSYDYTNCPYCKKGIKVDALVNGHGYSEL